MNYVFQTCLEQEDQNQKQGKKVACVMLDLHQFHAIFEEIIDLLFSILRDSMTSTNQTAGLFLIGVALGTYLPNLPEPVSILNPYIGMILIIIAVILLIRN